MAQPPIVIIDYGAGNLRSVVNAAAHAEMEAAVTNDASRIRGAAGVILPGVGAAADTMANLRHHHLVDVVRDVVDTGMPFLGVCMGLQALFTLSEEGGRHECLGVVPGTVRRFPAGLKIPHMGWNQVHRTAAFQDHPLFEGIPDGAHFYFVHSYYVQPDQPALSHVAGETEYGERFTSVLIRDNLVATQFHPEKSGRYGLQLYANFSEIVRRSA